MTNDYIITPPGEDSTRLITYSDSVSRYQTQLPLALSWLTASGYSSSDVLFSDDDAEYLDFPAGSHQTVMYIQTKDRYNGLSVTLVSGSISVLVQLSEYFSDPNPAMIAAPYTASGEAGEQNVLLATYYQDTPENADDYKIPITGPGTYKIAFPRPLVGNIMFVTHSGSFPYRISQMLPRKSVQAYDIEVNSIKAYHISSTLIDTIALQVSDSIVVGPDLIGAKSIDGSKIIDGTISGVLIQNGAVTGNKILAGTISGVLLEGETITGDKIAAGTIDATKVTTTFLDAVSAQVTDSLVIGSGQITNKSIDGSKIVDGTISGVLIRDGTIFANKIAAGTITAAQIAVSGITADNLAANSITTDKINARVITADKIVLSGITSELLGAQAVTAAALASGAVVSGKVAADAIYGSNIVGGSITGYHVAANTITGDRIQANTISGSLITGSSITADKLDVSKLSAISAKMGTLDVTEKISVTTGYLEAGISRLDSTGIKIGDANTALSETSALRILGSGSAGDIVGMAFYNGVFSAAAPQAVIQIDASNALEIENRYDGAGTAATNMNFVTGKTGQFNIYNADLNINRSPSSPADILPGAIYGYDSDRNRPRYYLGADQFYLSDNISNTFVVTAAGGNITTSGTINAGGDITTLGALNTTGNIQVNGTNFKVTGSSGDVVSKGDLHADGNFHLGTGSLTFEVTSSTGATRIDGLLSANGGITTTGNFLSKSITDNTALTLNSSTRAFALTTPYINYAENTGKPTLTITGSGASGTSGSITLNNSSVGTPGQKQGYINLDGNNTLEITNQVTNGQLHLNLPNNGTMRVYVNSPATEQFAVNSTGATITGTLDVTGQTTAAALRASGAVGFGTSYNKFTVAAATGNTAVAGTLGVTGKITNTDMGYITLRRSTTLSITTAGTTITWNSITRDNNITYSTDTITIANAGYYAISATFATVDNLTSLRMTLSRGTINYVSTLHGAGLSTGNGYIFNFNIMFWASANSTYKVVLTPSSNTTLNANAEGLAGPSPIINIAQLIGV